MAKKDKRQNEKPVSAGLSSHQAEHALINYLTKMPDGDEVLRKAGVTRARLKVMMYDDEIYQAIEKRQDKLESAPWRIEPADRSESKILEEHLRDWWSEILLGAQNARWYGYSVLEAVYSKPEEPILHIDGDTITPFIGFKWIGEKPMQWYEPKNDGRLMLLANYNGGRVDTETDQRFKHFLTRCKSTFENPYGEALLSRLYWVWFFKSAGFKFWAKFVEKFGMPMLVGKTVGKTTDMRDALLQAHASSVIALSGTDEVKIEGAGNGNGNSSSTFETFDKNLERRIQKVILGGTLTSGTDGSGSRALGEVHLEVQNSKYKADIRMIMPTIQTILNALCDLNGWQRHRIIIGEEKSLEAPKADRDVKLKNAGANLTSQYFQREYGLQDGDIAEVQQLPANTQFKALPNRAFSFKADMQGLDANQQEVDEKISEIDKKLFSESELMKVVETSSDVNDLQTKLYGLMSGESVEKFTETMARALYLFDVIGYVQRSK
ncbi:phage portal protein family protein [Acinetobacter bohemicus]|uniref:phage portal protein family protein n=1 Tax=Acinetobacter bohemicus TaxID=1435036 RepID=UPI00192B787D|nr:DUF935 family protein [Acinetobacter bohemicus]CAD9195555.1 hypothetical protein QAC21B_01681 [Acinetobacter bohemicus]